MPLLKKPSLSKDDMKKLQTSVKARLCSENQEKVIANRIRSHLGIKTYP